MESRPTAWIINFGNELLIGRIVNTNGAWLAERLTLLGFNVRRIIVAPDDEEAVEVLKEAGERARVVVCTGGLGPTFDDRTAEFLAKALGVRLVEHPEALKMVEGKYAAMGMPLTPERRKMALLPEGAEPIPNPVGTAPGILVEKRNALYACLPGVPREMEAMFREYVEKVLKRIAPPTCIYEASVVVKGVPESSLAPALKSIARSCRETCYVKSHPKGHELKEPVLDVRVLVSSSECSRASSEAERLAKMIEETAAKIGGRIASLTLRKLSD